MRCHGAGRRLAEIRLSQPSAEELAALLAYEDTAQPEGPMLTPDAIGRISAYAKSNLHWAVPMADAARSFAEAEGKREVTPEIVRAALLDIWSPEQLQPGHSLSPNEPDVLKTSHLPPVSPPRPDVAEVPGTEEKAASPPEAAPADSLADTSPVPPGDSRIAPAEVSTSVDSRSRVLRLAPAAFLLLLGSGVLAFVLHEGLTDLTSPQPPAVVQEGPHPDQVNWNPWGQSQAPAPETAAFDRWDPGMSGSQADPVFNAPPELVGIMPQSWVSWEELMHNEDRSKKQAPAEIPKKQRSRSVTSRGWVQTR
jgi:hypothetical protein